MNATQNKFVQKILNGIPALLGAMKSGNYKSELILGRRRIGERIIILKLVAEVDPNPSDPGIHGSGNPRD